MRLNKIPQIRRQKGLGYTGYLIVLAVSIFIGLFAIKVGPFYFEHWTVTAVAEGLVENEEIMSQPRSKVYQYINQAYRQNNLWDLEAEDTISLKRDGKLGYLVTVQYERRANLFHNIDLVTSFNESPNAVE